MNQIQAKERTLRVAFPGPVKLSSYEPTRIALDYEYIVLENLFSPLIEINADGSLGAGVAEKVEWEGDVLNLTIRSHLQTFSGQPITASDVEFSLKRLLVLAGNTHGNFKDIVCPGQELKSVEDRCDGIEVRDNTVRIHTHGKKSFLIPMLGVIDFAVIPRWSVDPITLKIHDFSETSGVYSVASEQNGKVYLRANPTHYLYQKDISQSVVLVPVDPTVKGASLEAFRKGDVDHLMTVDAAKADDQIAFAQGQRDVNSHVTMKIRTMLLAFTDRGMAELNLEQRKWIGRQVRSVFHKLFSDVRGFEPRSEFFPTMSEGALTNEQLAMVEKSLSNATEVQLPQLRIGFIKRGPLAEWAAPIQQVLPTAECYVENNVPDFKTYGSSSQIPHAFIASTDTGFTEDISLISYSMNAGLLGVAKPERSKWLERYMATSDKSLRIHQLRDLHFNALSKAAIVPLLGSPYSAIVRKPWKLELSELYANNQLWRIKLH